MDTRVYSVLVEGTATAWGTPTAKRNARMKHIGQLIQQRREAMGLTQAGLSREMGGYPSPSLMSRIEDGSVDLTPNSAAKYADALMLDKDTFFNAAGFATPAQLTDAIGSLERSLGKDVPIMVSVPVVDPDYPDLMTATTTRTRELKKAEDVFIVDLMGSRNLPYIGEVLASRTRKPKDGQGVIAEVTGKLILSIQVNEDRSVDITPSEWVKDWVHPDT